MRNCIILALLTSLALACQKEEAPNTDNAEVATEDFSDFYDKFLSDSLFQMKHITFPLAGLPAYAQTTDGDFRWEKADWRMHRSFDPDATGFESEFTPLGSEIMIERIVHKESKYGMIRRFARLDGSWYLIYYAGVNELS